MKIEKADLIRELENESSRCSQYTAHMYQVLQFTFVAIIALAVCGFSDNVTDDGFKVIFRLVLPICFYIFGTLYAFNACALAKCGKREEIIHFALFKRMEITNGAEMISLDKDESSLIARNVVVDRWVSMIAYGVTLGFYLILPAASVAIGYVVNKGPTTMPYFIIGILPNVGLVIYFILMIVIICKICSNHFGINKIQKENRDKVSKEVLV